MYWFHPLVWVGVFSTPALEAEKACDDAVMRGGSDAAAYAALQLVRYGGERLPGRSLISHAVLHMGAAVDVGNAGAGARPFRRPLQTRAGHANQSRCGIECDRTYRSAGFTESSNGY